MYVCIFTYAYGVLDYDVQCVSLGHGQMNEVTAVKEAHSTINCCPSIPLDCPQVPELTLTQTSWERAVAHITWWLSQPRSNPVLFRKQMAQGNRFQV